jgi:Tol biopolymer transport system component
MMTDTQFFQILKILIIPITFLFLTGCGQVVLEEFPNTDIVYQTGSLNEPKMGFVNSDGTNSTVIKIDQLRAKPIWSIDGKTIYTLNFSGRGGDRGRISIIPEGKRSHECRGWNPVETIGSIVAEGNSTRAVINNNEYQILLVDIDRCTQIDKYIEISNTDNSKRLLGASLSSDGKRLIYSELTNKGTSNAEYSINLFDIDSRQIKEIGHGAYPIWSPNDQLIAFIDLDGIYVMAADGSQIRQLAKHDLSNPPFYPKEIMIAPPNPRWSPDGKWLVYHICVEQCLGAGNDSIFKIEVATGNETEIVDDGQYPYWRIK